MVEMSSPFSARFDAGDLHGVEGAGDLEIAQVARDKQVGAAGTEHGEKVNASMIPTVQ